MSNMRIFMVYNNLINVALWIPSRYIYVLFFDKIQNTLKVII